MKKHLFGFISALFFFSIILSPWPPQVAQAQITTSGCYICPATAGTPNPSSCTRVGTPDAAGNCTQGEPIFVNPSTGQITTGTGVPNSLSYTPLEPIPGSGGAPTDFCTLLNLLFKVLIYLGGMIAVLFLVLGGIAYMVSEVVDKRSTARERIKSSVIGLVILLSTYLILFTINPNLVNACNVLNGNSGGVVQSQSSINVENAQRIAAAKAKCESNSSSKFCMGPTGTTCATAGAYNKNAAICEDITPGQICVTRFVPALGVGC